MHKVADIVRVDGTIERLPCTVAKLGFERIQTIVGGYFEHAMGVNGNRVELWCNENGIAEGLTDNPLASILTGHHVQGDAIVERWE